MQQTDLFLIGLGDLGSVILELVVREPSVGRILVGSRHAERGKARCDLARIGAMAQGYSPEIGFLQLDLNQPDKTGQIVLDHNPKIILCTASMMTWWLHTLFPFEQREILKATGFGAWLPVHLTLPLKLMEALDRIDYPGFTLIAPFPDVVNPVLKTRGYTPTGGIGNLDEIVPKIRYLGSQKMGVDPDELQVTLVAHHALESWAFGEGEGEPPPYYLRIEHQGSDITEEVNAEELLFTPFPLSEGPAWNYLSAGSAVRMIKALLSDLESRLHAPGPNGLPGGYPVLVNKDGIRLDLPDDLPVGSAIEINSRSHRFDGIEGIEDDGTVVFTERTVELMQGLIGFGINRLKPDDAERHSKELISRFTAFAKEYGVALPIGVG